MSAAVMNFDFSLMDLSQPVGTDDSITLRREQFAQANASLGLEGTGMDTVDLEIQGAVITGRLSADEAVALYIERTDVKAES